MPTRRVLDGRVLGVEYALTPLGQSLQGPFSILFDWTVENIDRIQDCQRSYDRRQDQPQAERVTLNSSAPSVSVVSLAGWACLPRLC